MQSHLALVLLIVVDWVTLDFRFVLDFMATGDFEQLCLSCGEGVLHEGVVVISVTSWWQCTNAGKCIQYIVY